VSAEFCMSGIARMTASRLRAFANSDASAAAGAFP